MKIKHKTSQMMCFLAQGIILMWALWISVVSLTDLCNLLAGFGFLPEQFPASSHNLERILYFLKHYHLNSYPLAMTIFTVINLWVFVIAIAYWRAFIAYFTDREHYVYRALTAFLINMSLFIFFLVADEIFIQYLASHSHMNTLLFITASMCVFIYLMNQENQ